MLVTSLLFSLLILSRPAGSCVEPASRAAQTAQRPEPGDPTPTPLPGEPTDPPELEQPTPQPDPGIATPDPKAPCCFTNPRYAGTCVVTPTGDETCASILDYLNDQRSAGKTYCASTEIRGGWRPIQCTARDG
jgi:hypothetical protein